MLNCVSTPARPPHPAPGPDIAPEDETARIERLIAMGLLEAPAEPGGIPDELLEPGPACPGIVEALLEDRRNSP